MTFKPPLPGELNHLADVQKFVATGKDANGQLTGTWELVTQAYVRRDGISGRIAEIARQLFEAASHNIYLRYNGDINRSCRIVIGDAVYAIGWIDTEGAEWMRCTCEESWPDSTGGA